MELRKILRKNSFFSAINSLYREYFSVTRRKFGFIHPTAFYRQPILVKGIENVYMYERTSILGHAIILTTEAKFIMKKYSGVAEGLTVITGNHGSRVGTWFRDMGKFVKEDFLDKDVVVEEDVWIGANVTLLSGVTVGRGAVIGSGSIIRNNVPPYAMVFGNPAKVVGFRFTPKEIIEHEKVLYSADERLASDLLEKNYQKYFLKRIKNIKEFVQI